MKQLNHIFYRKYKLGYILYNPYTDAIKYVNEIENVDENVLENKGVLFSEGINGPSISRYIISKSKISNFGELQITDSFSYSCNLKCVYCMQQNISEADNRMEPSVRVAEWKQLMNLHHSKHLNVCLFGGEPFLNITYLSEVLEIAKEEIGDISYSVVTNGTLVDSRVIKLINTYSINRIQITIDGPENIHNRRRVSQNINCYQEIIKNIYTLLKETNSQIIINNVMDISNYSEIDLMTDELIQKFKEYIFIDNPRIIFNYGMECHPFGKSDYTKDHIPELIQYNKDYLKLLKKQIIKKIPVTEILPTPLCILKDENDILIAPNGDIYKCITGLGAEEFKVISYSKLWENPLTYFEKYDRPSDTL